jgi:hypothetical protein
MPYELNSTSIGDLLTINLVTDKETRYFIQRDVDKNGSTIHGGLMYFLTDDGYAVKAV